jgi:5-methylthioadenosine/S-adenosylhomocysteine deaminase
MSLFGAMDLGTKLQKLANADNTAMAAKDALYLATFGGAQALGLGDKIGSLEVGKQADFISVSFDFPHMQPIHDVVSQLVYAAQGLEVRHVVCAGKVLLENARFRTLNQKQIMNDVERFRKKIHKTLSELRAK